MASMAVVLEALLFSVLTPLLPYLSERFAFREGLAGLLVGSYAAGVVVFALPVSLVLRRVGGKPIALLGLGLMAIGCITFSLARDPASLGAARFTQGVAAVCVWEGAFVWVLASAVRERRNELVGTVIGLGILGSMLGPSVGVVAVYVGPRSCFLALAVVAVLLAAGAATLPAAAERPRPAVPRIRNRRVLGVGIWLTFVPSLLLGALGVLGPLQLSGHGASAPVIAAVFLMSAGVEALVSVIAGRICDRRGPQTLLTVCLVAAALESVGLGVAGTAFTLAAAIILAGAVLGMAWVSTNAVLALAGDSDGGGMGQETVFALWLVGWSLGQMLGAAGGARVAVATSSQVAYLTLAFLYCVTLAFIHRAPAALVGGILAPRHVVR